MGHWTGRVFEVQSEYGKCTLSSRISIYVKSNMIVIFDKSLLCLHGSQKSIDMHQMVCEEKCIVYHLTYETH